MVGVDCNLNVLCTASRTGNTGIDHSDILAVHIVDFPPSISCMSQEIGQSGRKNKETPDEHMFQVVTHMDSFSNVHKIINDKQTRSGDPIHILYHVEEFIEAATLFSSFNAWHHVTMEMRLGNPSGCRIALPPCGVCPNCEKVKIFQSTKKIVSN